MLAILARDDRLDRPRAVGVLKRREAADSEPAGAPAAADALLGRLEDHAVARLDEVAGVVAGVAGRVLADGVVAVEGGQPGSGGALFDQGCVGWIVAWEGEGCGSEGEED